MRNEMLEAPVCQRVTPLRSRRGFTLIEVMIAVAVVAILAAIAYPSYVSSVRKSNGRAAQAFMMDIATRQKQYLLDRRTYAGDLTALGVTVPKDVDKHYGFTITPSNTPPAFTITATAKTGSIQLKDDWGKLSLDSRDQKLPDGKW